MSDNYRSLTDGEILLAQSVFGDSINYNEIKIYNHAKYIDSLGFFTLPKIRPHAPDGNIYFAPESVNGNNILEHDITGIVGSQYNPSYTDDFIHEMVHVWQYHLSFASFI